MVHVLIILAFALTRVGSLTGESATAPALSAGPEPWPHASIWIALSPWLVCPLLWAGLAWVVRRAGQALDIRGERRWLAGLDAAVTLVRVASLAVLAVAVLVGGWDRWLRGQIGDLVLLDELIIAAPVLLTLLASWWLLEPIDRRLREASLLRTLDEGRPLRALPTRWQSLWSHVRHAMLLVMVPLCALLAWGEVVERLPAWMDAVEWHAGATWVARYREPLQWGGVLAVLCCGPLAVRLLWDTLEIRTGQVRQQVDAILARYRVRVRGPLVWGTHGSQVNAAILGMFWPLRYLLISDALLDRLSSSQLEVVLAHEVAHVKHRHLVWLGVCVLACGLCLGWGAELATSLLVRAGLVGGSPTLVLALSTLLALAGTVLWFGFVSRRFEWQADAFAVRHMHVRGREIAERAGEGEGEIVPARSMSSSTPVPNGRITPQAAGLASQTLEAVAWWNGVSQRRFSFRHGSIAHRRARMEALAGADPSRLGIDRVVRWIKAGSALALVLALVPDAWVLLHALRDAAQ